MFIYGSTCPITFNKWRGVMSPMSLGFMSPMIMRDVYNSLQYKKLSSLQLRINHWFDKVYLTLRMFSLVLS